MKLNNQIVCGLVGMVGLVSSSAFGATPGQFLFTLGTDGSNFDQNGQETQLVCKFYVATTAGALSAFSFTCNDGTAKTFTLAQIKTNQVIRASGSHKVCQLKTNPGFDPVHGGGLTLTYLSEGGLSASNDSYGTMQFELTNAGSQYVILTGPDAGQKQFNYMFMKARHGFLGIIDGIASISESTTNTPLHFTEYSEFAEQDFSAE